APAASATCSHTFTLTAARTNTATASGTSGNASVSATATATVNSFNCVCTLAYPDNSNLPRSGVLFNESEVLRASSPGNNSCATTGSSIKLWYNDEHALTLGVRRAIVKNSSGTTTTDFAITPSPAGPACVSNPLVGTTALSGD